MLILMFQIIKRMKGTTKLCFGGGNDPCQECETSVLAQAYNTCGKDMYIEFMFYPTSEEC